MTAEALSIEEEIIERSSSGIQKLPMLDVFFGRIPLDIVSSLKTRAGLLVSAESRPVRYDSWSRMIGEMDEFGVCVIAKAKPWGGQIFICMDPSFLYGALEMQMGGTPRKTQRPGRPPTAIEKRIAQRVSDVVIGVVAENFSRLTEVSLASEGVEVIRQAMSAQPAQAPCSACSIHLRIGEVEGVITVVIPISTLDPVQSTMSKMFLGERLGDLTWRDHIRQTITGSHVDLVAVLHEFGASMNDVLEWRVGDEIPIGITELPEIRLSCSGAEILYGAGGLCRDNRYAVSVEREAVPECATKASASEPVTGFRIGLTQAELA